jgi:hypothetical protein
MSMVPSSLKERLLDDTIDGTQLPHANAALDAFFRFTD